LRVACVQMNSSEHWHENIEQVEMYVEQAASLDIELLVFPENFSLMAHSTQQKKDMAQHYEAIIEGIRSLAKQHQINIVAGSLIFQDKQQYLNRSVVFSKDGKQLANYDKIHLFDAYVKDEKSYKESDFFTAGKRPVWAQLDAWKIGLSICYDVRFPELYRYYSAMGCTLLCVPSAFTYHTGYAHWECLLRTRAIENQCYVLAAAQWGHHPNNRQTWGHSMIIDPWGTILHCKEAGTGLVVAEIQAQQITNVHQQMPVLQHRRLY